MITRLEVGTSRGKTLSLVLSDPANGYIVQDIQGLEPVKATLVTTSFANMDGEQYHSSRREARDIKLTLGLDTGNALASVSALRRQLYDYFMPKTNVNMRFVMSDGLNVVISGRVESFDTPLFTKDPAVDITVRCFDPDFVDPTPVVLTKNTANETVDANTQLNIEYDGTVETGLVLALNINRPLGEFLVYHSGDDQVLRVMEFSAALQIDDRVEISTVPGNKYVTVQRGGETKSYLFGMSPQSPWVDLRPGMNRLRVYAEGAGIPYSVTYTNRYGGL